MKKNNSFFKLIVAVFCTTLIFSSCVKQMDYGPNIQALTNTVNTLQSALNSSISALQKSRDSLSNALSQTNTNLSTTNASVANLSKSLDSVKTALQVVNTKLSYLSLRIDSANTQIASLNTQLLISNSNIVSINAQINVINTNIANFTTSINLLNQDYNQLLAQLNYILSQLNSPAFTLLNGLLAYFPFTGNANDSSGNGNNGIVNGATLTSDRFGNSNSAYSFNGYNYIITPGINLSSSNQMSISVWINNSNPSGPTNQNIYRQEIWGGPNTYDNLDFLLEIQNNGNRIAYGLATGVQNTTINPGAYTELRAVINPSNFNSIWHLIIATYDGSNKKLFIDGILVGTEAKTGNVVYSSSKSGIAVAPANLVEFFNGKVDDLRIYNRALTQSEITYLAAH